MIKRSSKLFIPISLLSFTYLSGSCWSLKNVMFPPAVAVEHPIHHRFKFDNFCGTTPMILTIGHRRHRNLHHDDRYKLTIVSSSTSPSSSSSDDDDEGSSFLSNRIHQIRSEILDYQLKQPPNPDLSPTEFIIATLTSLRNADHPFPDSGCRVLFRSSTNKWKNQILKSIGAPPLEVSSQQHSSSSSSSSDSKAREDEVASALNAALMRPKNQFGILVRATEDEDDYVIHFPSDTVDYEDGNCWLECQLRSKVGKGESSDLLVMMGWELRKRKSDGAWLIEKIDWQDFRDYYRPGIGREEWIRVFG